MMKTAPHQVTEIDGRRPMAGKTMGIINRLCNVAAWWPGIFRRGRSISESGSAPGLTALRIRELLDEREIANRLILKENLLLGTLDADEYFKYDVLAFIAAERDAVHISCIADRFKIPGVKLQDALLFCNRWNNEKMFPTVFVDPSHTAFRTKYTVLLDKMNTTDFLREQVVDRGLGTSRGFFMEAGRNFADDCGIIEGRSS